MRFEIADSLPRLCVQVTAEDDIVLIADGVLPDCAVLVDALAQRTGVLAFPEEPAMSRGFERLDATRAWSGALRTRGECVARLADLPADCDLASSLLRIALQMGARVIELDPALIAEGTWQRRVDRRGLADIERRWMNRQVQPASFAAPGLALTQRIGLRWAQDAGGGRWARAPHAAAFVAGALALLALLVEWPVAGLGAVMAAACALAVAVMFDRVEALGARPRPVRPVLAIARWLVDGLLVALLSKLVVTVPSWLGLVLALLLVGLLRLGEMNARSRLRSLFADRIVLLAGLIPAAYLGAATIAVAALVIACLAVLLWSANAPTAEITTD